MALDVATLPLILYRKVYTHALSMYYIVRTSYTFLPCFINLPFLLHFFISIYYTALQIKNMDRVKIMIHDHSRDLIGVLSK